MSTKFSCCEVCDRNPTCGVDCGSCEGPPEAVPHVCKWHRTGPDTLFCWDCRKELHEPEEK